MNLSGDAEPQARELPSPGYVNQLELAYCARLTRYALAAIDEESSSISSM